MSAKIKTPPTHHHSPMPRGTSQRAFQKVYWPYIPVVLAFAILLPMAFQSGALNRLAKHPFGKVLAYSTSQNPGSMLAETNLLREQNGQPNLKLNDNLSKAASAKAADMAARDYWSHNTPEGTPPWSFVTAAGYTYHKIGENLATGFYNEEEAVKGWLASIPHRENMLDPNYTEVGFGFANSPNYSAVGGPATIFVAYYGQPQNAPIILAGQPQSTYKAPSSANPTVKLLSTQTAPVQVALSSRTQLAAWSPVALGLMLIGIFSWLAIKHVRLLRRSLRTTEYFVWHHPVFDVALLGLAALIAILWQTIGLVQ